VKKVYLAKSGDCYKIGISENPKERIKGISTACPEKVELIDCWDSEDAKKVERSIHGWLDDYNTNGEWFKLSENFAHFFCSIAAIAGVDETVAIITSFTNYQFDLISLLHRIVMEKIDGKK